MYFQQFCIVYNFLFLNFYVSIFFVRSNEGERPEQEGEGQQEMPIEQEAEEVLAHEEPVTQKTDGDVNSEQGQMLQKMGLLQDQLGAALKDKVLTFSYTLQKCFTYTNIFLLCM